MDPFFIKKAIDFQEIIVAEDFPVPFFQRTALCTEKRSLDFFRTELSIQLVF